MDKRIEGCEHTEFYQPTGNCLDCTMHYQDIIEGLQVALAAERRYKENCIKTIDETLKPQIAELEAENKTLREDIAEGCRENGIIVDNSLKQIGELKSRLSTLTEAAKEIHELVDCYNPDHEPSMEDVQSLNEWFKVILTVQSIVSTAIEEVGNE